MDFKFVSHGLWSEKQRILRQNPKLFFMHVLSLLTKDVPKLINSVSRDVITGRSIG